MGRLLNCSLQNRSMLGDQVRAELPLCHDATPISINKVYSDIIPRSRVSRGRVGRPSNMGRHHFFLSIIHTSYSQLSTYRPTITNDKQQHARYSCKPSAYERHGRTNLTYRAPPRASLPELSTRHPVSPERPPPLSASKVIRTPRNTFIDPLFLPITRSSLFERWTRMDWQYSKMKV